MTALSPACWASGGSHISLPCQASHPNGGLHLENCDPLVKSTNRVYSSSRSLPSSKYPVANYKAKSWFHTCTSGYPTAPALLEQRQNHTKPTPGTERTRNWGGKRAAPFPSPWPPRGQAAQPPRTPQLTCPPRGTPGSQYPAGGVQTLDPISLADNLSLS